MISLGQGYQPQSVPKPLVSNVPTKTRSLERNRMKSASCAFTFVCQIGLICSDETPDIVDSKLSSTTSSSTCPTLAIDLMAIPPQLYMDSFTAENGTFHCITVPAHTTLFATRMSNNLKNTKKLNFYHNTTKQILQVASFGRFAAIHLLCFGPLILPLVGAYMWSGYYNCIMECGTQWRVLQILGVVHS